MKNDIRALQVAKGKFPKCLRSVKFSGTPWSEFFIVGKARQPALV